ncbi:MAG: hypothetical protein QXF90_00705 [Thermofilaceae archaeon]
MGVKRGGQVRLLEAALAGITAVLLLTLVLRLILLLPTQLTRPLLEEEANTILRALLSRGVLCKTVYHSQGGTVDGETLRVAVEAFTPPGRGYKVAVLRASDLTELFAFASGGFNSYSSASSFAVLSGCNGYFEPRIVVISISGD